MPSSTDDLPTSRDERMTISLSYPLPPTSDSPAPPTKKSSKAATTIIPLSLPAILQNPRARPSPLAPHVPKKATREEVLLSGVVGKRRRRRFENALLSSNPHILRPTNFDLLPRPAPGVPTFSPRPALFPSSLLVPALPLPAGAPSLSGQFTLSLKGVRRALRRSGSEGGARARDVVEVVETSLRSWLGEGGKGAGEFYDRTTGDKSGRIIDPTPYLAPVVAGGDAVAEQLAIVELSRAPHALLWAIPDPYDRFIVHCVARYYGIVSFSKEAPGGAGGARITHLLRPHMVSPTGGVGLDTPPGTDLSATEGESSAVESSVESLVGTEGSEMGDSDWEEIVAPRDDASDSGVELSTTTVGSVGYDTDDADADVGTDDDAASELDLSIADLSLVAVPSPLPPFSSPPPFAPSTPIRSSLTTSPSTTPRPYASTSPASTPTPRARRTRASFPPASSRIREDETSASRSRSRSPVRVWTVPGSGVQKAPGVGKGWSMPERTFGDFLFA